MDLWFVTFFWSDYSLQFCCFWQICINNGAKNTTKIFHSVVSCLKCWKSSIQEMSKLLNPEEIRVLQLFTNYFKETEVHHSYSPKQILEKIIQIYFHIRNKRYGKSKKAWISLIPLLKLFLIFPKEIPKCIVVSIFVVILVEMYLLIQPIQLRILRRQRCLWISACDQYSERNLCSQPLLKIFSQKSKLLFSGWCFNLLPGCTMQSRRRCKVGC